MFIKGDTLARQPDYDQAVSYAIAQLQSNLDPNLTYHNLWHTENDVMPGAVRLARLSGVTEDETQLLRVAAAFHDIGFIVANEGHEIIGAREAAQILPQYGFSNRQIERIMGMIMATRMPQSPRNLLEEILADADLDVLGREDFFARNQQLRLEMAYFGQVMTEKEWLEFQSSFLQEHSYFTAAAKKLRNETKRRHIAQVHLELARLPV